MGGLRWERIGLLEVVAWLGVEAGTGALIVGLELDGLLSEVQGPWLD